MKTLITTLFEGDYHYGVGVLINSLIRSGYTGQVYCGYKGNLPVWVKNQMSAENDDIPTICKNGIEIFFINIVSERNLTNYKPDFMLQVRNMFADNNTNIFFFDADIFLEAKWDFFEYWISLGCCLVIDGNSPLPYNAPLKSKWRSIFTKLGYSFVEKNDYHYNGGFVGFQAVQVWAIEAWKTIQEEMEKSVRLDLPISLVGEKEYKRSRTFEFYLTDQDALNIVADINDLKISPIGPEAMGWKDPTDYMHHALGSHKPWKRGYTLRALRKGKKPTKLDYRYWNIATAGPIQLFSKTELMFIKLDLRIAKYACLLGRFWSS